MDYPMQMPLPFPARSVARVVAIQSFDIPSIPLAEARERFLTEMRWETSKITKRRISEATVTKYRDWLKRFERWLVSNRVPLDLGVLDDDVISRLQASVLEEIDDGELKDSSASTYLRCIKLLFTHTWGRLGLEPSTDPTFRMHPGSQVVSEFPLFTADHVRRLMAATMRQRGPMVAPWIPYRDRVVLACFFDLGWRAKEAANATLDDVDLRGRYVTIRKENVKVFRGRVVGINPELSRLLSQWIEKWRPSVPHLYLFVSDDGRRFTQEGMRQMFRRLAKAAGIPPELARSSPHTCRHYFAVQWAKAHPGDLAGLQRALGHTNYRSTRRYLERAEDIGAAERQQEMQPNWR